MRLIFETYRGYPKSVEVKFEADEEIPKRLQEIIQELNSMVLPNYFEFPLTEDKE